MGVMDLRRRIMLNEPHIVTTTPSGVANFSTDLIAPLKSCKVEFSPVQSGSGDPSPENVRPISGWTGIEAYRTGKNIGVFQVNSFTNNAGTYYNGNNSWCQQSNRYSSLLGLKITYSAFIDATNVSGSNLNTVKIWGKKKDGNWAFLARSGNDISPGSSGISSVTITIPADLDWIVFGLGLGPNATASNPMVEVGSTATAYEPYTGSTIPINWTTEAGTVYGGYVDLVTGELVAEWGNVDLGTLKWYYSAKNNRNFFYAPASGRKPNDTMMCSSYLYSGEAWDSSMADKADKTLWGDFGISATIKIKDSAYTDANTFKTAMSGVQLVYKLATPITYQLTPTQLKSLRGVNNIWSDANGDTTVKYWAH